MDLLMIPIYIFVFLFGITVGSFLNAKPRRTKIVLGNTSCGYAMLSLTHRKCSITVFISPEHE